MTGTGKEEDRVAGKSKNDAGTLTAVSIYCRCHAVKLTE